MSKVSSYTTDIQGYNSIILSQGSYSIELQGGKSGSSGYTGPYQEIFYCNGNPGQSGETSTFDSVNEYYSATSDNVKNFTINLDKIGRQDSLPSIHSAHVLFTEIEKIGTYHMSRYSPDFWIIQQTSHCTKRTGEA